MEINADFSKRVAVHAGRLPWKASPMAGVDRRMLDRLGDEVARATSIVRYAPGSHFSPHVHTGGEEFLVLDGVFQDEHGDFPVGSYIRNPPQSSHTPGSAPGCVIFVKLWQFDPDDRAAVKLDTGQMPYEDHPHDAAVRTKPLYRDDREDVTLEEWAPGASIQLRDHRGLEVLVLDGGFEEAGEGFARQSWLRLPDGANTTATAGPSGAHVWTKRHHLHQPPRTPAQ